MLAQAPSEIYPTMLISQNLKNLNINFVKGQTKFSCRPTRSMVYKGMVYKGQNVSSTQDQGGSRWWGQWGRGPTNILGSIL